MKKQRATTTIRLDEQDKQMIAWIKEYYGVKADNEAIRIALRETVRAIHQQSPPATTPTRNGHSSPE
jgi:Arc/MetJ family transcription regulator